MAKKQTRRSISVSRTTYERLKAFCEANNISMSQFVETPRRTTSSATDDRGRADVRRRRAPSRAFSGRRQPSIPRPGRAAARRRSRRPGRAPVAPAPVPMTSAAARFAVEPPPPIIKPKQETAAPKPAEKRPDQIFTF